MGCKLLLVVKFEAEMEVGRSDDRRSLVLMTADLHLKILISKKSLHRQMMNIYKSMQINDINQLGLK